MRNSSFEDDKVEYISLLTSGVAFVESLVYFG